MTVTSVMHAVVVFHAARLPSAGHLGHLILGLREAMMYSRRMDNTSEPGKAVPHLVHRELFKEALANYRISERGQQVLANTKLVLLTAATASGRNTIIDYMLQSGKYHFIVSDTTRQPRINNGVLEQNGREYWFRNEADMLKDIKRGEFLEAELIHDQQVSGISIRELEKARRENKIAINEVDIGGFLAVLQARPTTVAIIILPPSFEEWQRRIAGRGAMSSVEFKRRMETAARIFKVAIQNKQAILVINDTIEGAAQRIDQITHEGIVDTQSQEQGRALAAQLYAQTKELLLTL